MWTTQSGHVGCARRFLLLTSTHLVSQPDTDGPPSYESLRLRQDRYGPGTFWAMTAFRTRVDSPEDPPHRPPPHPPHPSPVDMHITHSHTHPPEFRVLGERMFSPEEEDDEDEEEEEEEPQRETPQTSRMMSSRTGGMMEPRAPPGYVLTGERQRGPGGLGSFAKGLVKL